MLFMACLLCVLNRVLNDRYIHCGRAFFPFFDVKGHAVAFVQRLEAGSIDSRMMHEYIRAIFLFDETIAFFIAKPFYCSISHSDTLLSKNSHGPKLPGATFNKWNFPSERTRPANMGRPL